MEFRLAAITVGQSPRGDILPEIRGAIHTEIEITEFGVLDGLAETDITDMAPTGTENRLCTRLRDGGEVITSKAKTAERLNIILNQVSDGNFDEILLLCTGKFDHVHCSKPFIEAQRLVDGYIAAMAFGGRKIGLIVPVAEQIKEPKNHTGYKPTTVVHASPYSGDRLRQAGRELADMDLIVMHCMGYTRSMRQEVIEASGKPAALARNIIAAGISQLI